MSLLSVIIPAHNEQESVERVLRDVDKQKEKLKDLNYELEILLVLNCCTDDTGAIAQRISFAYDIPVRILREERKGYGYAHRVGIAEAKGDVLLTLDCDNTYPADIIPELLEMMEQGYGFITTDRLSLQPAMGKTSKLGNFLLTLATRCLTGQKMADSQSGMWLFRRRHIADLLAGIGTGMELSEQLKIRLARTAHWTEVPIKYYERTGDSKLNPVGDGIRCLWRLVTI